MYLQFLALDYPVIIQLYTLNSYDHDYKCTDDDLQIDCGYIQ